MMIRTDEEHTAALKRIDALWGTAPGTPESDELDVLATLVEAYEERRWPRVETDPVDAIVCVMEWGGRSQAELAALLGSASRASEILARKCRLTTAMIHRLSEAWHIPASLLVKPYALAHEARAREAQDA